MLSPLRFEKISGHEPTIHPFEAGLFKASCICACGKYVQTIWGHARNSESRALESLRDAVLAAHGLIVIERQNWHCIWCDRALPLEVDHIESRAHGRSDVVSNLRALCCDCHRMRHRRNIKDPKVRPADLPRTPIWSD